MTGSEAMIGGTSVPKEKGPVWGPMRAAGSAAFQVVALVGRHGAAGHSAALRIAFGGPAAGAQRRVLHPGLHAVAHVLGHLLHLPGVLLRRGVPLAQDLAGRLAAAQA